ncbi:DNA polymerase III subunit gamma/tau [Ezakiella peruensis]|uniref:DNA polymerase III subunit gamma/tau n=1 Tax=Ezakiella peruensis TaxID=1464038 RepID=UPI000C1B1ABE|nr:DNA polymerase III subunit gamma/tau [Ezakiella peruensis]
MKKALYRVLRPMTFAEVIDKDIITSVLKNQIKNQATSHGYLFCGTHGTGKTSVAKIFSRAVNCLNPIDGEPCNKCKNCLEILEDRSVDVLELDAASNNGVDNIRELKSMGVYPPTNLKKKVYIIDEAHMLSNSAFNALLKILEEPPAHLIFILATTDPDKLPDTVKSRVQRFDFHTISKRAIEKALKNAAVKLNEDIDDSVFKLIANESRGSMRDALSALDQVLGLPQRPIGEKEAVELLGLTGIYELMPLVRAMINFDYMGVLNETDQLEDLGRSPEKLIYSLMQIFRDLYVLKIDQEADVLNKEEYFKIINQIEVPAIINILERLRLILNDITNAYDRFMVFQIGLLGIVKDDYIKSQSYPTGPVERPMPSVGSRESEKQNAISNASSGSRESENKNVISNSSSKASDNENKNAISNADSKSLAKQEPAQSQAQDFGGDDPYANLDFIEGVDMEEAYDFEPEAKSTKPRASDQASKSDRSVTSEGAVTSEPAQASDQAVTNEPAQVSEQAVTSEHAQANEPVETNEAIEKSEVADTNEATATNESEEVSPENIDEDNPSGNEIYELLVDKLPLLVDINEVFFIRMEGDHLIFRLKNPAVNDDRLDMFKAEIEEVIFDSYGRRVSILKENEDPAIERAKALFGDKLNIIS